MRIALIVVGVLSGLVAVFYAFNAYIQLQERGFTEAIDIPIAAGAAIVADASFALSRRA